MRLKPRATASLLLFLLATVRRKVLPRILVASANATVGKLLHARVFLLL